MRKTVSSAGSRRRFIIAICISVSKSDTARMPRKITDAPIRRAYSHSIRRQRPKWPRRRWSGSVRLRPNLQKRPSSLNEYSAEAAEEDYTPQTVPADDVPVTA